jgi:uncharacterized protein
MKQEQRYLYEALTELALERGKMAFLSGPRQVGKTTMAQSYKRDYDQFIYKNWDEASVKKNWSRDPDLLITDFDLSKINQKKLLILDEIHKAKGWKSKLKGIYDTKKELFNILVTGSAKLNVYKKGSDSLLGRYLHFRLHPFSIREVHGLTPVLPDELEKIIFVDRPKDYSFDFEKIQHLYNFSGFPEPYLNSNKKIHILWKRGRKEKIMREDILDLSRIQEISKIEILCAILPEKIGTPLSVQSLREDLSVSHDTATRWLSYLKELYYFFDLSPYSKSISRSLKKEQKIYFYDWTECENDGEKFENFVASHLLKACHYWEDTGEGEFKLQYLRDKDKNEVDFLIVKNKKPWFTVECKLHQKSLDISHKKFQKQINCPHIQVVYDMETFQKIDSKTWIMGVDYLLGHLV